MTQDWSALNRAYLCAEIDRVAQVLDGNHETTPSSWELDREPALVRLTKAFSLSAFERNIIVMCAGHALQSSFASKLGAKPTLGLALAKLEDPHLDALSPAAPLRLFHLVTVATGGDLLHVPLALDERILYFLLGSSAIDRRLLPYLLADNARLASLTARQAQLARRITAKLMKCTPAAVVQLFGGHALARLAVLRAAAVAAGMDVLRLRASALALAPAESEEVQRLCERELLLSGALPLIEIDTFDGPDAIHAARMFALNLPHVSAISTTEPVSVGHANSALFEMQSITATERRAAWTAAMATEADRFAPELDRLASQFRLDPAEIHDVVDGVDASSDEPVAEQLWRLCRERSRPRVEDLARRIIPATTWDDLVVPPAIAAQLRDIVGQLRHRHAVHELWGYARGDARGQAITALFTGPSGTGKTLAAEVIASDTSLDLYHVDLSQVIDKYVGETEKRLRRIFDAAETGGAILLFDEADALFGKRANVERGTDRWANIEVSYLLQRMESYNGLAILTTNAKDALDTAFMRRLRFVVQFPFPDARLRTELWRRAIPPDAPRASVDIDKLARLQLTGANIKGIAINAAFHAAAEDTPLAMRHLIRAARSEFAKLELPFPEGDVRSWAGGVG